MTNEELADKYREVVDSFDEPVPMDYYDRVVDLAVYFNETLEEGDSKNTILGSLEKVMVDAYKLRDGVFND